MNGTDKLAAMEIDLDIAECWEILEAHGIRPRPALLFALWRWKDEYGRIQPGEEPHD